jgi:thiol:disulfide interchange protein DsbA
VKYFKFLPVILISSMALMACQQSDSDKSSSTEPAPHPVTHEDSDKHDHQSHEHQATETGYIEVEPQDSCEQPTVIEFFAYQCPHCFQLEPFAEKWKTALHQNPTANFISIPTTLGREEFLPFLIIHYTAEKTGVLEKIQPQLFAMIHQQKGGFNNLDELVKLFVEAGADEQQVRTTLEDEAYLKSKFEADYQTMKKYKITGVPTVLVNYQYQITVSTAGGYDKVFEVVDKALKLPAKCFQ